MDAVFSVWHRNYTQTHNSYDFHIRPAKNRWHPAEGHSVFFLSKHEGQQKEGKLSFSVIIVFCKYILP